MKFRKQSLRSRMLATGVGAALLVSGLCGSTASAVPAPVGSRRPDPCAKGSARLMDRPPPECLPSERASRELGLLHTNWCHLSPERFRFPTVRSNHTLSIAIHVMNRNPGRPVLVLIHGVLANYTTWKYVTPGLVQDYEVWLVDLPGCGDSDAPKPGDIEPDGFSPTAMAERVLQALEQMQFLESTHVPRPIVLVGHSLGGTVCLRMLSAPELRSRHASMVNHVERMVLFAPGDLAINAVPTEFLKVLGLKGWMVGVARALGIWDGKVRDLTKHSFHRTECATAERQNQFDRALKDARGREAAKAMLREFTPFDPKTMRPIWPAIDALVADYKHINVPVLIVHGTWDETLSGAMGHKLKNQIQDAWLVEIPHSGHSLPTEQPVQCAQLITRFVATGEVDPISEPGLTIYPGTTSLSPILASTPAPGTQPEPGGISHLTSEELP